MKSLKCSLDKNQGNIIMGDFNVNAQHNITLNATMAELGLRQLVCEPTTTGNTLIDHIYSDLCDDRIQSGVLESYYSYHKPVWLSVMSQ